MLQSTKEQSVKQSRSDCAERDSLLAKEKVMVLRCLRWPFTESVRICALVTDPKPWVSSTQPSQHTKGRAKSHMRPHTYVISDRIM